MRQTFIAGNWKMNLSHHECVALAAQLAEKVGTSSDVELAVCPPSVYLGAVKEALGDSAVALGGQNMYHEEEGAFTGEISAAMLLDVGCRNVILGHSERRQWLKETDQQVNQKVLAALKTTLIPIVCVGETLEERDAGRTREVVSRQFEGSLAGLSREQMARVVIAYEPVWAIGTGKVATPEQAEEVHADLRRMVGNRYNAELAAAVRIQYGGSVKPKNALELLVQPNIDGALVGGASLEAESFLGIIAAAREAFAKKTAAGSRNG